MGVREGQSDDKGQTMGEGVSNGEGVRWGAFRLEREEVRCQEISEPKDLRQGNTEEPTAICPDEHK